MSGGGSYEQWPQFLHSSQCQHRVAEGRGSEGSEEQRLALPALSKCVVVPAFTKAEVMGGSEEVVVDAGVVEDVSSALLAFLPKVSLIDVFWGSLAHLSSITHVLTVARLPTEVTGHSSGASTGSEGGGSKCRVTR